MSAFAADPHGGHPPKPTDAFTPENPAHSENAGNFCQKRRIQERLAGIKGVPQPGQGPAVPLDSKALDAAALIELAIQLASTVGAIHRAGVVHRDINPKNVLLDEETQSPLLTGFRHATTVVEEHPGFVHQNEMHGRLAYMAPEQTGRMGRALDQRADLYSLGATLYELATGRPPFSAEDPLQLIYEVLTRMPSPPADQNPDLPQALSEIILHLLEKEPDRRYQSAEGLVHDLYKLQLDVKFEIGERDFPLRLSPPSRLIGRSEEIETLKAAFENMLAGGRRGVFVSGAPGVGKSALVNELRRIATTRRGWFVAGKFDQYRRDLASDAVREAIRGLGRLLLAEPEERLAALRKRIHKAIGSNAGLLVSIQPEFGILLGVEPELITGDPLKAEDRLIQAGTALLRALASPERPIVMVVDDLQWAAPTPINFIDAVLTDDTIEGLLLVGTFRDREITETHPLAGMLARWDRLGVTPLSMRLQNLPTSDLGELLQEMLRLEAEQAASLAETVGARTGGNPFDTVELLNALRRDGILCAGIEGWDWQPEAIRRYVGQTDVLQMLAARMEGLPESSNALLNLIACLGGEVGMELLEAASGFARAALEENLGPALDEGLLLMDHQSSTVRFRHDRVQQAAYGRLEPVSRQYLHLAIGQHLAKVPDYEELAAEQLLPAVALVEGNEERRALVGLLYRAAGKARLVNYPLAERLLASAIAVLQKVETPEDRQLLVDVQTAYHAALYRLCRFDEADAVYQVIEARCDDVLALVDAACVQISSLCSRFQTHEAIALGLSLLKRFGLVPPEEKDEADFRRQLQTLRGWAEEDKQRESAGHPEASDPVVRAISKLANTTMPSAFFCNHRIMAWLVLAIRKLWVEHGPCAHMVGVMGHIGFVMGEFGEEYRIGYDSIRHVLETSEARGYEPATSQVRFLSAVSSISWFEPVENGISQSQAAREGLVRGGDLYNASYTHFPSITALLESAPTLDRYLIEVDAGVAFANRTGNHHAAGNYLCHRYLIQALREHDGRTEEETGEPFCKELAEARGVNSLATAYFHIHNSLGAALFDDTAALLKHSAQTMALLPHLASLYPSIFAYLFRALALLRLAPTAGKTEKESLLTQIAGYRDWLALRAADAPMNFLHLVKWVDAERAWAVGDNWMAATTFDAALREPAVRKRPWHQALITERAGIFHLQHGLQHTGETLLKEAKERYEAWGATAKVRQLQRTYSFLAVETQVRSREQEALCGDSIDLLAIIRASQALSSETSFERLQARVAELLSALTGAAKIALVLRNESAGGWTLTAGAENIGIEEAGARGLLPLSAFRYVERTREPLLIEDATRDGRFSQDPYLAEAECCSLMLVPILNQGALRAILFLENRLSRGAFSAARLDAVLLVAGQLTVSLDNALLYASLEHKVADRTQALEQTHRQLLDVSRQAGMAEVATSVLHNIGNVLNSVNVSCSLIDAALRKSVTKSLNRTADLLKEQSGNLIQFFTADPKGRALPEFIVKLAEQLRQEQAWMLNEIKALSQNIEHIKAIVTVQQRYATVGGIREKLDLAELVEDALRMNINGLDRHHIEVVRELGNVPCVSVEKHKVLQILVNLVSNAKHALIESERSDKRLLVRLARPHPDRVSVTIKDNGIGIAPENQTRVFAYGFTTKKNGHGFGLHGGALAAREMGGKLTVESAGPGHGASFVLELPVVE